jgi:hypothetical protein
MQTGEPYLLFTDTVNNAMPAHQKRLGLKVTQSNLCSEITLPTGVDHRGVDRTAVCCLSSVNAETFLEWSKEPMFMEDVFRFLDNVLEDFIERAPPEMARAVYSAKRERSVGLGVMGFHSFLQAMNVSLESATAKSLNLKIFKHIRQGADAASRPPSAGAGAGAASASSATITVQAPQSPSPQPSLVPVQARSSRSRSSRVRSGGTSRSVTGAPRRMNRISWDFMPCVLVAGRPSCARVKQVSPMHHTR